MIRINTSFSPFRLKLSRRQSVKLCVELTNTGEKEVMATLAIKLGKELSFEKGGFKEEEMRRIESIPPGKKKDLYFEVFAKANTRTKEQPIILNLVEHYKNFNYVIKENWKEIELKVEE